MKRPGILVTILFFITFALGSLPYAVKRFRADTASKIDEAKLNWLASRSDALLSLSNAIVSAPETHNMKEGARAAYSLLDDYVILQNSVKYTKNNRIPWDADGIDQLRQKLYAIGWPESDLPTGPQRVILPPSSH